MQSSITYEILLNYKATLYRVSSVANAKFPDQAQLGHMESFLTSANCNIMANFKLSFREVSVPELNHIYLLGTSSSITDALTELLVCQPAPEIPTEL